MLLSVVVVLVFVVVKFLVCVVVRFVRMVKFSVLFIMNDVLIMLDVRFDLFGVILFMVVSSIGLNVILVFKFSNSMLGSMFIIKLLLVGVCVNSISLMFVISKFNDSGV